MDKLEKGLLMVLLSSSVFATYLGFSNPDLFTNRYMMEDGAVEYATVLLLLASCLLVGYRWFTYNRAQPIRFTLVSALIIFSFFFVAGEELSWGQRILGLETTEYFKQHNAQEELNLHNLVVEGVKINKLIFGLILTTVIIIYLVLIPILYHKMKSASYLIDKWYIPVPRLRHVIIYLALNLVISQIPASKNWEFLEFGSVLIFFLILWNPVNYHLFKTQGK